MANKRFCVYFSGEKGKRAQEILQSTKSPSNYIINAILAYHYLEECEQANKHLPVAPRGGYNYPSRSPEEMIPVPLAHEQREMYSEPRWDNEPHRREEPPEPFDYGMRQAPPPPAPVPTRNPYNENRNRIASDNTQRPVPEYRGDKIMSYHDDNEENSSNVNAAMAKNILSVFR